MIVNNSLKPTQKNINDALTSNNAGYNNFINCFLSFLSTVDDSVISIDAKWGNGKTFVAKQMEFLINSFFGKSNDDTSEEQSYPDIKIDKNICNSLYSIYYNTWENDNNNDPMVSFLYHLIKMLNYKFKDNTIIQIFGDIIKNVVEILSYGVLKLDKSEKNSLEKVLASVLNSDLVKSEIKKLLEELKHKNCTKLIIFVDELDRCRPQYALLFLEMIKSYIQIEGIVVVCLTDMRALSKGINSIFGNKYDAFNYLDKLFDFRFELQGNQTPENYIKNRYRYEKDDSVYNVVLFNFIKKEKLSLRQIDKLFGYIKSDIDNIKKPRQYDATYYHFLYCIIKPIIIGLKLFNIEEYERLILCDFDYVLSLFRNEEGKQLLEDIYINKSDEDPKSDEECLEHDLNIVVNCINNIDNNDKLIAARYNIYNYKNIILTFNLINYISGENSNEKKRF